jgi:hypothetical protein
MHASYRQSMLILVLAIVLAPLAWLAIGRLRHADPVTRARMARWTVVCVGIALAARVGLAAPLALRIALVAVAIGAVAVWLRRRGGGGGPGDDGHEPPVDPGPDPGGARRPLPRRDRLDADAFDRARAEWDEAMKKPASD